MSNDEDRPAHTPDTPDSPELTARKAQLKARSTMICDHLFDEFRLADVIIVQAMMKFGGGLPDEITNKDKEALLWGHWLRDMKRAIDSTDGKPELIPFPPLPSWLTMNPGLATLCERLGIECQSPSA